MLSTFQPRQVEGKAIRRWAGLAFTLLGRGFVVWLLLVTCSGLLIHLP